MKALNWTTENVIGMHSVRCNSIRAKAYNFYTKYLAE